ncbi:hypothetical protein CONLIGDRAFT_684375 [Coniochaeta ligniaria NRRL 30616]|uniref:Uncharacterized protein n=1 Tax=Coniochaeta ligniaria NRRL 30616 TaxID=1408157 RepID=A0A1J7IEL1_9PEZI|nr:hypothetical protein CONLIGDRAFT_684375 [Coniochaeta ligniaria NRRL 30616]
MAPDGQSTLKRHADEITPDETTPDETTPDEQGGEKRRKISPPNKIEEKSREINIKIHLTDINIDVSFTWWIKEGTTIRDLHKTINRKMQLLAAATTWSEVMVNDLVKTKNSLRTMPEPGKLAKYLGLEPIMAKTRTTMLNLNEYGLDHNLWALVKDIWKCQDPSTWILKLDVAMPN